MKNIVRQGSTMKWIFLDSWCMCDKLRIQNIERWIGIWRGLSRVNKSNLSVRRESIQKIPPWWIWIRCPTQILKKKIEVAHYLRSLDVLHVGSNIRVSVFQARMRTLGVERRVTTWDISQYFRQKGRDTNQAPQNC